VVVFAPDEVEGVAHQDDGDDEVADVTVLLVGCDIAESQLVETRLPGVWRDSTENIRRVRSRSRLTYESGMQMMNVKRKYGTSMCNPNTFKKRTKK